MVKYSLDRVAHAIASEPRRAILDCLAEGEASMSHLAARLDVSLPAVDKHLPCWPRAGVVTKSKTGRTTSVRLVPGSLDDLATWAMQHAADVDQRAGPPRAAPGGAGCVTTGTVTVTRRVAATPDRVFAAWTDAERLAAWWWPQLAGTTYDVDARPGGRFRIRSPAIGATVTRRLHRGRPAAAAGLQLALGGRRRAGRPSSRTP